MRSNTPFTWPLHSISEMKSTTKDNLYVLHNDMIP